MNGVSSLGAELIARYNAGAYSADGGSAEISAYNSFNGFIYSVNGVKGTLDCVQANNISNGETVGTLTGVELSAAKMAERLDDDFTYGDITSVAISSDKRKLAVALQDKDYSKSGRVLVFECLEDGTLNYVGMAKTGVQPDMVCFNEDDTFILTADEGEPRMGKTEVDPKGSVTRISTSDLSSEVIDFTAYDSERDSLIAKGIVIQKDSAPSVDFEPEYIAISGDKAYVCLQEANAIAVFAINEKKFIDVYSVGFEDYSRIPVDLNKGDETYNPATYENIKGIRMPDGISTYTMNGETYLLTANEGDSRAWPVTTEEFVNEIKDKTSPVNKIKMDSKVTWFDVSQYDGLEANMDYVFGARSFTIFKVTESGLEEVFDSASDFEKITAQVLPDYFNCSNDVIDVEDRSGKKGPEPESVIVGTIGERTYAFIGLERIGGVMMYDITEPGNAIFENYINSRDFSADIKNDDSPEGLYFVTANESPVKKPLLVVSNEVSGTISIIELDYKCEHEHDWDTEYTVDREATCTEDGLESIHCKTCDETKEERPISALGHDYSILHYDSTGHWYQCSRCDDKTEVKPHSFGNDNICDVCGYEKTESHTHSYGAWKSDNAKHWKECSCGNKIDVTSHEFKWKIDREATNSMAGSKHEECAICGYKRPEVEIPVIKTGNEINQTAENSTNGTSGTTNTPQTGDTNNFALWFALLLVSCSGAAGAVIYGKRKKENRY